MRYSTICLVAAIICFIAGAGIFMLALFARLESSMGFPLLKVSMFRKPDFTSIFICLHIKKN